MSDIAREKEDFADARVSDRSSNELSADQLAVNERKLVMKMDLRILPVLCVVYLMAFIDRYVKIKIEI